MDFSPTDLLSFMPRLLAGLGVSFEITAIAVVVGSLVAIVVYLGKASADRVVSAACSTYIEVIRNTPLLVQLYIIFFGLPAVGLNLDAFSSAAIGLTIHNAAYIAEVYRGGFESVPRGLHDAAAALGLSRRQAFIHVSFVPAIRAVYPSFVNQTVLIFLASSIASVLSLNELTHAMLAINRETYRTMEVFILGGALYLAAAALLMAAARLLEPRLFRWAKA